MYLQNEIKAMLLMFKTDATLSKVKIYIIYFFFYIMFVRLITTRKHLNEGNNPTPVT